MQEQAGCQSDTTINDLKGGRTQVTTPDAPVATPAEAVKAEEKVDPASPAARAAAGATGAAGRSSTLVGVVSTAALRLATLCLVSLLRCTDGQVRCSTAHVEFILFLYADI